MGNKKIFVGYLPKNTSETDIRALFEEYGNIEEICMKKSCAFVTMRNSLMANKAIAELNATFFRGRTLIVEPAGKKTYNPVRFEKKPFQQERNSRIKNSNQASVGTNPFRNDGGMDQDDLGYYRRPPQRSYHFNATDHSLRSNRSIVRYGSTNNLFTRRPRRNVSTSRTAGSVENIYKYNNRTHNDFQWQNYITNNYTVATTSMNRYTIASRECKCVSTSTSLLNDNDQSEQLWTRRRRRNESVPSTLHSNETRASEDFEGVSAKQKKFCDNTFNANIH